jgi:hypothetical protein
MNKSILIFTLSVLVLSFLATLANAQDVSRAEIARVRYELTKVEQKMKNAAGQQFELSDNDRMAFRLVKELADRDKDNQAVNDLVAKAKEIYNAAKGVLFEITPEMIAYRTRQNSLTKTMGEAADAQWAEIEASITEETGIPTAFPIQLPPDVHPDSMIGRQVMLQVGDYEKDLFVQLGRNWIACGDETKGFYFVDGSCSRFNALFTALQRYRNTIQNQVNGSWVFMGEIEGAAMLAPDGTQQTAGAPHIGWRVVPTAIHIPGTVTVILDEEAEGGATFVNEAELSQLRQFTVTEVPDDVEPMELVRIYVTAVKEKNWDLHLACIDPKQCYHSGQIDSLKYNWSVQQKGLERIHAHAEPVEVSDIKITRGRVDDDLEDFFGDGDAKRPKVRKEERAVVTVRLFNVEGAQTVRPRFVTLIRRESGRWYIWSGATLTF